jgi:acyl-CoA synthetase
MLACEKAGIVAVGIGSRAGAREVEHLVARTGARTLFTVEPPPTAPGTEHPIGPQDLWFLNSTSGTTGLPKIVMHDQARWFAFHDFAQRIAQFRADDVFLSALPAPFGFGLWTAHFTPAIVGAPCIVCERFDADAVVAAIARYRVTVLAAVSTQFVMLLNSPAADEHDLSSLRILFTGGEMVPYERAREFEERTGAKVLQFYGSNETGALSATTLADSLESGCGLPAASSPRCTCACSTPTRTPTSPRRAVRACLRARAPRCASGTGTTPPRTSGCSPPTAGCAWATSRPSTATGTSPSWAAPPT